MKKFTFSNNKTAVKCIFDEKPSLKTAFYNNRRRHLRLSISDAVLLTVDLLIAIN